MFRIFSSRLEDVLEKSYRPQRLLGCSDKTLRVYRITLRFFCKFLGRCARVSDLTDESLAGYAEWRLREVSRGTCKRDMDCLLALWRYCHQRRLTKIYPQIKPIHAPTPTPIALTQEQVSSVWKAIQTHPVPVLTSCMPRQLVPGPLWWSPLFLVCWDSAERVSPVFDLKESDIDLDKCWVRFPASTRKGSREDNWKPIHKDTAAAMQRLLNCYPKRTYNSRVFRWASNRGTLWPALGAIMVRAGLPDSREFKFHCIRKSSVTHLEALGGDGCRHAGHSSDAVTRKHYLDPRILRNGDATDLLFRPGS